MRISLGPIHKCDCPVILSATLRSVRSILDSSSMKKGTAVPLQNPVGDGRIVTSESEHRKRSWAEGTTLDVAVRVPRLRT